MNAMTQDAASRSRDYQRIATALQYLHEHHTEAPSLAAAAQQAGLSEYHFQRLFSRWAGISPKRYLQFLGKSHARALLQESAPVLEAALAAGLSGPGRLHDLMVSTEAASPGELRSGGQGMHIGWAIHDTPFGPCLIGISRRGICHLGFVDGDPTAAERALRIAWPGAVLSRDDDAGRMEVETIFRLTEARQPLHLLLKGTNFQVQVWQALLAIPRGSVGSYGQLASALGRPTASRAIGSAIGANPIAYLIPCHRVIRSLGEYGEYRWGPVRKRLILATETLSERAA